MPRSRSELEKDAMQLPSQERALLAEHLIASLDAQEDADVEELWLQEAERRYQAYREGKLKAKPAAQTLHDAANKLR